MRALRYSFMSLLLLALCVLPFISSTAAAATACLNDCSGHGLCSPASTCLCDDGYLAVDCHVQSLMSPLCVPPSPSFLSSPASSSAPSPYCFYWRILDGVYYHRVVAVTVPNPSNPSNASNPGWAGVLWDNDPSKGPMTGGKAVVVSAPSPYAPLVQDYYATTEDTPTLTSAQSISPLNVTGHSSASSLDVSFQRPCDSPYPQHFSFPTRPGATTPLAVAWLGSAFAYHSDQAHTFAPIDLVAASSPSACLADCSGHGACIAQGTAPVCRCDAGYLGSDCSVQSLMAPLCLNAGAFCAYWRLGASSLYMRVVAVTNPKATTSAPAAGYAAVMWGAAPDGMTNGTGHRVSWNATASQPLVWDLYAARRGPPSRAAVQVAFDVTGWATNTSLDVSFQRPLLAVDAQHFSLSSLPGVTVPLSVALGEVTMAHHTWAQQVQVDMAATAAGGAQCPGECSGHGRCASNAACHCDAGYLGADCATAALMRPLCYHDGALCALWRIVGADLLVRISATPNPTANATGPPAAGYAAVMWGAAPDGMTNGTGHRISWNATASQPLVWDLYATRRGPPSRAAVQVAFDVTGWANATSLDISFTRPLLAPDAQHFTISAARGVVVPFSVASGPTTFSHHAWAEYSSVDMALQAAGARCPNDCSGNGQCTAAAACHCRAGYLGADCSVPALMAPRCATVPSGAALCLYWRFVEQQLLMRLVADVNATTGWAAVMWGAAADGMTGGMGHRVSLSPDGYPVVVDIAASGRSRPSVTAAQVTSAVAGSNTSLDVSFTRPLAGLDAQHFNLSAEAGALVPLSVAMGPVVFNHHTFANYSLVDMAATAAGTGCPRSCSGHGACLASSSTCQCDDGWLGLGCSVVAAQSLCPHSPAFCMAWAVTNATLYMRVRAAVQGWAGVMWGAGDDGMTGGRLITLTMPQGVPSAVEMVSGGQSTPQVAAWNGVGGNVAGYTSGEYSEWSFERPCDLGVEGALQVPTVAGVKVPLSWAMKDGAFSPHAHTADVRGQVLVDMVTGEAEVITRPSLIPLYLPFVVAAVAVVVCGLMLRVPAVGGSGVGRCCLRKRLSSLGADGYALAAAHAGERAPLASDSQDAALVVQSDDSLTLTSSLLALLSHIDNLSLNAATSLYHLTVGELLVVAAYGAAVGGFILAAAGSTLTWPVVLGHLTAIHVTLSVLPVSRNSVWHFVFGVSFDRAVKWHRYVARATVLCIAFHCVLVVSRYGLNVLLSTAPLPHGMAAVYGTLAAVCIVVMAVTAVSLIRRGLFELFYYVHVPLFASTMLFASLHSVYARYYLLCPIALIAADWALRIVRHARAVQVVDAAVLSNEEEGRWRVAKLTLKAPMHPAPGQYVFVNVPALSVLQWHPFSVSSAVEQSEEGATFTLHLLDMGKGTFTSQVCDLLAASEYSGAAQLKVSVDGPYGSLTLPYQRYPTLLLVAGGIGITPLASLLYSLLASSTDQRVTLVWSSRHAASFHLLFPDLLTRMQADPRMAVELFDTARRGRVASRGGMTLGVGTEELLRGELMSEEKDVDGVAVRGWTGTEPVEGRVAVRRGRPCLPRIFEMVAVEHQQREAKRRVDPQMKGAKGVGVICCGPTALLDGVEQEAMHFGFHLHRETFIL